MNRKAFKTGSLDGRADLILLVVTSFICVAALVMAFASSMGERIWAGPFAIAGPLAGCIAVGILGVLAWRTQARATKPGETARFETAPRPIDHDRWVAADAFIAAEPQILFVWEQRAALRIVVQSLRDVAGLPSEPSDLMDFDHWLEPASGRSFRRALEDLYATGKPFAFIVKTNANGHLEADGRAMGGRAVLRLRDLTGHKRDLLAIVERHQRLNRDIRASRALLDTIPSPVWFRDTDGRLSWVNEAYARAVDATHGREVIGKQIELLDARERQIVNRSLSKGSNFQKRLALTVDGDPRPHDVLALPIDGSSAGVALDATAIDLVRSEYDRHVHAYDRTLDRVSTAVATFDRDQKLTFFNDAFRRLWDLDQDWLQKQPVHAAILDRLRDSGRLPEVGNYREWKVKILSCYKTGLEQDNWWHLPDGRVVHFIADLRPDGGVTTLYVDDSERLSLERRFNALTRVQGETLNSLKEGVAVFATNGRLKLFNPAFARIWKQPAEALDGEPHIDAVIALCRATDVDNRVWSDLSQAVTAFSEQRGTLDGQIARGDGVVIDYAATPLPDGATLLTFADVTASKRYERALVERNDALELADKLKNQFIGHVSYELRTPLTNIIGFSELLSSPRTGPLTAKQRDYLADISSSSRTLLAIIDDILDLATIDAGALELRVSAVDVRKVVQSAVDGIRDRAARARLTLDIGIAKDAVTFTADEQRVRQILYNLLANAIGFTEAGKSVHLSCWREAANIVFAVEDEGLGIPREQQQQIFARFESNSYGSRHRGAGLGLSLVKSLVDLHGGVMNLVSEPGRGTRVSVSLPVAGRTGNVLPIAHGLLDS